MDSKNEIVFPQKMKKWLLFLLIFAGLNFFNKVSASISSPYVVDEKPRVLFEDSYEIENHYGLENYKTEYVDGYLHISYTYTHDALHATLYSPVLYLFTSDPRLNPQLYKIRQPIPFLLPFFSGIGAPPDWYQYDIQFTPDKKIIILVKEKGSILAYDLRFLNLNEDDTDWVGLANDYPDSPTDNSMAFTPIPIKEPVQEDASKTPVIIIPGIMGSYLNSSDGDEIWINKPKMLLPGGDDYLNELLMDENGNSIKKINTGNLITNNGNIDFYGSLLDSFKNNGYVINQNLFIFTYDWRDGIQINSNKLRDKILDILTLTKNKKVNIISHSFGSLITKEYLKQDENVVDNYINIGTPNLGSPKIFKILNYGDNLNAFILNGLLGLNSNRIKIISQNMPSIYELLPSSKYGDYVYDLDDLDNNGVTGKLSYQETKEFLKNSGRNSLLIDDAEKIHQDLDDFNPKDLEIKTFSIVGCGVETVGKFFILNQEESGGVEYNILYVNGDGTVPLKSAEWMSSDRTYYVKGGIHSNLPSNSDVIGLIFRIFESTSTKNIDISSYASLATNISNCNIPNGKIVSFHSPIELHIYDSDGHHAGPNINGDIENIDGVDYEIIDGNKFAYLPDGKNYKVNGVGVGIGTFNSRIQKIVDGEVFQTLYFNSVPVSTSSQIIVNQNSLSIDQNNDGVTDYEVLPSAVLDKTQSNDFIKPITQINTEEVGNDTKFDKPVKVTLTASDDNSGILITEFSLNNGPWQKYESKFMVNKKNQNFIKYRSIDRAGNVEVTKTATIIINKPVNSKQ